MDHTVAKLVERLIFNIVNAAGWVLCCDLTFAFKVGWLSCFLLFRVASDVLQVMVVLEATAPLTGFGPLHQV